MIIEREEFGEAKVVKSWLKTLEVGDLELELVVGDIVAAFKVAVLQISNCRWISACMMNDEHLLNVKFPNWVHIAIDFRK